MIEDDPINFRQAMESFNSQKLIDAMNDEIKSMRDNDVWDPIPFPEGAKPIGCKWIFKKKLRPDGSIDKFKARLVAKGFTQRPGVDFFDVYAPVARITTIRVLIALASINKFVIHHMNVKTAFLNGDLDEEIYMDQPEGFIVPGQEKKVCKLIRSLYGLK